MSRTRPDFFGPGFVAMAHRGGAKLAANQGRENSLAAFAEAVRIGYRYLETDVQTTADGVLIAFHDPVLDRATDRSGKIAELPWKAVARARIGGSEPIPRLDEVLEAFDIKINIDLKSDGAIAALASAIQRHQAVDRVCVGSFSWRRLRAFRRLAGPGVATSASTAEVAAARLFPIGPPTRRNGDSIAYQVPRRHRIGPVSMPVVTAGFIRRAHGAGRLVHVWTIDDPDEMNDLIDLGVDGLISDRIDVLREVLIARDLW